MKLVRRSWVAIKKFNLSFISKLFIRTRPMVLLGLILIAGCGFKSSDIQISYLKSRSIDSIQPQFQIKGVIGLDDSHVDDYFTDANSEPEILWNPFDNATNYELEMTDGKEGKILCQIQQIKPSSNPTIILSTALCPVLFLDGSTYFIKVTAIDPSGKKILATNSPYPFKVSRLASATSSFLTATSPVIADGIQTSQIKIQIRNNEQQPLEKRQVNLTVSGSSNSLGTCGPTDSEGRAECTLSSTLAEVKQINFSTQGLPGSPLQTSATFKAGDPSELVFLNQPSTVMTGSPFEPEIQVAVQDRYGNRLTDFNQNLSIALDNNPNSASLSGALTVAAVNGVAHFADLRLDKEGTSYTLVALHSNLSLSKGSDPFLTYDGKPTFISDNVVWSNSRLLSPLFTWEPPKNLGPGLQGYEISIGTGAGLADVLTWTAIGNVLSFQTTQTFLEGVTYYANIRTVSIENKRSPSLSSDGWTIDTTPPTQTPSFTLGSTPNNLTQAPPLGWSGISDAASGNDGVQIKIIDSTNASVVRDWTLGTSGQGIDGLALKSSTTYDFRIRAFDKARNFTNEIIGPSWTTPNFSPNSIPYSFGSGQFLQIGRSSMLSNPTEALAQIQLPGGLGIKEIVTGLFHLCILAINGDAYCLGDNQFGQLGNGSTISQTSPVLVTGGYKFSTLASGLYTTCGIQASDNKAHCWGHNTYQQTGSGGGSYLSAPAAVSGNKEFKKISLGAWHACGILTTGDLYCWGSNSVGQLGVGSSSPSMSALPLQISGTGWKAIALGDNHTCAIASDDTVQCWGYNASGQLGDNGSPTNKYGPTPTSDLRKFSHIFAGMGSSCGIEKSTSFAYCWGNNSSGQLGLSLNTTQLKIPTLQPAAPLGQFYAHLSMSSSHGCGIASNGSYCWGENLRGQLGDGTFTFRNGISASSQQIKGSIPFIQLTAGIRYTCGVSFDNKGYCWGDVPGVYQQHLPAPIHGGLRFSEVTGGSKHSCGIEVTTNQVYCWGDNTYGQLGTPGPLSSPTPILISGAQTYQSLSAGNFHTCGVTMSGSIFCWGLNNNGQLGKGDTNSTSSPTQVGSITNGVQVTGGNYHTCALDSSQKIYCWGLNDKGQLGDGTTTVRTSPVAIDASNSYLSLSAGTSVTCGIRVDRTAWCWGSHNSGQLGNNLAADILAHTSPIAVAGGLLYSEISVGGQHVCAISDSSGRIKCWGSNMKGQLGTFLGFQTGNQIQPTDIDSLDSFTKITAGGEHTCALHSGDSKLYCWGANDEGQAGLAPLQSFYTPTSISPHLNYSKISAGVKHTLGLATPAGP